MSLTSMLKGKDTKSLELQRVIKNILPKKNQFTTLTGAKAFDTKTVPITPYNSSNYKYAALTGTTIELMAKYHIGHLSRNIHRKTNARNTGLAVEGLYYLQNTLNKRDFKIIYSEYEKRYEYLRGYVENKSVTTDELIRSAMMSSKLENCKRSGRLPDDPVSYFSEEIPDSVYEDIRSLFKGFLTTFIDTKLIHEDSELDYHPIFGKTSLAVGGADADLFIDGTMYDFKTSKKRGYEWQEVGQLIGYALFSDISSEIFDLNELGNRNEFAYKTERIGLYRTRYDDIDYYELSNISSSDWENAKKEIKSLFKIIY